MKTSSKGRRRFRWLRVMGLMLSASLVVVCGAFYFLIGTDAGLRLMRNALSDYGGKALRVGAVHGRLLGHFELDDVRYTGADGTRVSLGRIRVDWLPAALLRRRLEIRVMNLSQVNIEVANSSRRPSAAPLRIPVQLPLDVKITALDVRGLTIQRPTATSVHFNSVHFGGSWIGSTLRIARLSTNWPRVGALTLEGRIQALPTGLRIRNLQLGGPGTISVSGFFGYAQSASKLQVTWKNLRWPLAAGGRGVFTNLTGQARLSGTLSHYQYVLRTKCRALKKPLTLTLSGSGDQRQLHIDAMALNAGLGGRATASGYVFWKPQRGANLVVRLHGLNPALFQPALPGQLNGQARIGIQFREGVPELTFVAKFERSRLRNYPLTMHGSGTLTPNYLALDSLRVDAAKGHALARGRLRWSPQLSGRLELTLAHIDPAAFAAPFHGDLNGYIRFNTANVAVTPRIAFEAKLGHSSLRGHPLSIQARGFAEKRTNVPQIDFKELSVGLGHTRLMVHGQVTPPFNLAGELDSPDLKVLDPHFGGELALKFRLRGDKKEPHVITHGQGRSLSWRAYRVDQLNWSADLDPTRQSTMKMDVTGIKAGMSISAATLDARGTEEYQHIRLTAVTARGRLDLRLAGGYNPRRREWGGQIVSLKLAPTNLPTWALHNSPGLLIGPKRLSLEPTCLNGGAGTFCLALQRAVEQPGLHVSWSLRAVQLAAFKMLLPQGDNLKGQLAGHGQLQWVNGNVTVAQARLDLSDAAYSLPGVPPLMLRSGHLAIQQKRHGALHARLDMVAEHGGVHAQFNLAPGGALTRRTLTGKAQVTVPHLAFIQPYLTEVQSLDGRIRGTLMLAGTLSRPKLNGQIALSSGRVRLLTPGIDIKDISVRVIGRGQGPLVISGSMASGGGRLQIDGQIDPTQSPLHAAMHIYGTNFQAMDTADARIWIDPNLRLVRDASGIHINGRVSVPKADLTPTGGLTRNGGVSVSPDQVIVGGKQRRSQGASIPVFARLGLTLGNAVRFDGYGLTTRITGALILNQIPQQAASATGQLRLIDGRYQAYGQKLTIKRGRLIFDGGSVTRPAIDILAVRKPRADIEVGVQVRGTLDAPKLTLTSTPPMRREEQLSWLLFGHPLAENSTANQSAIAGAALALGLSGGDYLAQRVGKSLGLDVISIGSAAGTGSAVAAQPQTISGAEIGGGSATEAASEAAQLTLGKYLTPRLFVGYGVSLFQPGQTFRLDYNLGSGFKLQTESGVTSGGDLIYSFEGGK